MKTMAFKRNQLCWTQGSYVHVQASIFGLWKNLWLSPCFLPPLLISDKSLIFLFFNHAVGEPIIARGTNNKYYGGEISSFDEANKKIDIAFDNCDAITYKTDDFSAVILDQEPFSLKYKDHVIAPYLGGYTQLIGFITSKCTSKAFNIRFDNNYNTWLKKSELRLFADASSPYEGWLWLKQIF